MSQTGAVRIALVHYTQPPVIGGVETVLAAHERLFTAAGHAVTTVCGKWEPAGLRATLARQDVVIIHNVLTMPFDLALTAELWDLSREFPAVRFLCWVHDIAAGHPDYAPTGDPRWELLAKAHAAFEYVVISEHRRAQWAQLTGVEARVIPNGVDPARALDLSKTVSQLAAQHALFTREIVLLHPARLLRRKRIEVSLRVTAALRKRGCDAALLVTAPPDPHNATAAIYAAEMRALRETLGLTADALFLRDELRATLSQEDVASLYRLADALIFPSREEGFGLPLLEAALHRLPIFCTDAPALNALPTGHVDLFHPDAKPAEIAERIARAIAASPAAQARKAVARDSSWEAIYRNNLAPLLRGD